MALWLVFRLVVRLLGLGVCNSSREFLGVLNDKYIVMKILKRIVLGLIGVAIIGVFVYIMHFEIVQQVLFGGFVIAAIGLLIYGIGVFIDDVLL